MAEFCFQRSGQLLFYQNVIAGSFIVIYGPFEKVSEYFVVFSYFDCHKQCCGSGMFIFIPDLASKRFRISDPFKRNYVFLTLNIIVKLSEI
jgi:hypothetical protein